MSNKYNLCQTKSKKNGLRLAQSKYVFIYEISKRKEDFSLALPLLQELSLIPSHNFQLEQNLQLLDGGFSRTLLEWKRDHPSGFFVVILWSFFETIYLAIYHFMLHIFAIGDT